MKKVIIIITLLSCSLLKAEETQQPKKAPTVTERAYLLAKGIGLGCVTAGLWYWTGWFSYDSYNALTIQHEARFLASYPVGRLYLPRGQANWAEQKRQDTFNARLPKVIAPLLLAGVMGYADYKLQISQKAWHAIKEACA